MKTLNIIRYLLFAISIVGLFANFAQNDYSWAMIYLSYGAMGITFLIEMIALPFQNRSTGKLTSFLFVENLLLLLISSGFLFKFFHLAGTNFIMVLGCAGIALLYLSYGIYFLSVNFKNEKRITLLIFLFTLSLFFLPIAYVFRWQHWNGMNELSALASILFFMCILTFRRKIKLGPVDEKTKEADLLAKKKRRILIAIFVLISIIISSYLDYQSFQYKFLKLGMLMLVVLLGFSIRNWKGENGLFFILKNTKGKMMLMFVFFGFWIFYTNMAVLDAAPKLYSNNLPPALEKMIEERYFSKTKTPEEIKKQIESYENNWSTFIDHRNEAELKNEGK